ncbi:MAG: ABC transporter permease, partial [Eubacteriales bacterium]|nr:ABC transporter permease [Eubacteriales bacterium]
AMMPDNDNFGVCYVSENFGRQAAGFSGSYNEFVFSFQNGADEDQIIDDAGQALYRYGVRETTKREDHLSDTMIQEELKQLDSMAKSLPILFLLVAALILVMMLGRMVKKDRMKIGILKALGYSNVQVMTHYVKYAVCAGVSGGACGAALGMGLAGAMTKNYLLFYNIPLLRIDFYYSYLLLAMLLAFLICALAGIVGARGVTKIAPADAMRAEPPKSGQKIFLEKIPFFWKRLAFSQKMVGKNIFRNKKRTVFVLTGVILTYAMMVFTASMPDVIDDIMNKHFEEFQKMDYNISFAMPVDKAVLPDFEKLVDVDYMEGKIEYPFELANGNVTQTVSIVGLTDGSDFYSFEETSGNSIDLPERGILLSENLANFLKVEKGDRIQVNSYLPNREDEYLDVKGVIKQSLGMNAYMEIDYMAKLLLDENIVTGVYLDSSDEKINEKLLRASNIATILSVADTRAVYDDYMILMNLYIGFMVIFSGILGFCIIYNATVISIGEREMEFSSLRVLGFGKNEIFRMILRENSIIMVVGILLGIPIGKLFTEYSSAAFTTKIYTLEMSPTLSAAIMATIFTVAFVFLAQLATYRKIQHLDFLQALKSRES